MSQTQWTEEEKSRLLNDAVKYIIPHFASNENLAREPRIFVRGEGCYVWDLDGKKYFDSFATLLTTVCGHNRPEVTQVVKEQMETLEFFPNYVDTFTVPLVELARTLAEIMPGELSVSFFVNSGSEANETALKMARQYHVERGERHRFKFVGRKDSYHATTLGGSSVTGLTWFREYFEPLLPGCVFAPAARDHERPQGMTSADYGKHCLDELEKLFVFEDPRTIAAMIMDPLPGSNTGYPLPPEGYLAGVRRLCDKYGILLIFDEIQTGFGKTGKWFFSDHYGVVPDIMTIGKGFTGGYIPLGAAVTTPKVADEFRRGPGTELRSGSTYGGHTVACAATLENIAIIQRENLVEHAAEMGAYLEWKLEEITRKHAIVGPIRGIGLLRAVFLVADRATGRPLEAELGVGTWIQRWCYENGMILRNNGEILVLAPSLIITTEEVDLVVDVLDRALTAAELEFKL